MNLYTQVVKYIEEYIDLTKPLLNEGEQKFPEVEGKLEFCLKELKKCEDYEGPIYKDN